MMRLALWLIACNVVIAATLVLGSWQTLQNSRAADEDAARQTAVNLANSLSIEVGAELRLIGNALETVALTIAQSNSGENLQSMVERAVTEQRSLLPHVAAMRFAAADGTVQAGLGPKEGKINISHRPYFEEAKHSQGMVVSEPLVSFVSDEWCIILARRLQSPDGVFRGVVYAVVTAEHFSKRFSQLDMGESGGVALRTNSLRLVARWAGSEPSTTVGLGEVVVSKEMLRHLEIDPDQGWYITPSATDNVERVTAYSRIRDYPLLMFTGLATQEFLASWRREVWQQVVLVCFIVLVTAGFSSYLFLRQRRERQARYQAVKVAREQSLLLENDLVGMIRVRDRKHVWGNKAVHRIFGYELGELRGQSTRQLFLDEETYEEVGRGYSAMQAGGRYSIQLPMRRKDGQAIWIDLSGAFVSEGESLWMMVDIDVLKRSETHAKDLALRDPLTGLANRRLLDIQIDNAVAQARHSGRFMALCYIDLDGFKQINDVHGHDAGDAVLNAIAQRLLDTVRGGDTVARLGGDEFAVILSPVTSMVEAVSVMRRCLTRIREAVRLGEGGLVYVDASMGVVMGNAASTPAGLLRVADETMYAAKRAGKGRIEVADEQPFEA